MPQRADQIERIKELVFRKKVESLHGISEHLGVGNRMVQLYLKELHALTSYTHSGHFITLPDIPRFNEHGIWFYQQVGFSKFGTRLNTITRLIEKNIEGFSREELEKILKIGISKQIQILLQRDELRRIKLGGRYLYVPENVMKSEKLKVKLLGDRQAEEHFAKEVEKKDLIALLKAVLVEKKVEISIKSIRSLAQKYILKIPVTRIYQLLMKFDLSEKKTP